MKNLLKPRGTPSSAARLAARRAPRGRPVMFQAWRELLFLHWEWDADALRERLPPGLELDFHEGKAYLGIVPFFMRRVRPRGLPPVPGLSNFLELNVRTYVHDESGVPGVWFFSLDANQAIACAVARRLFHLPYFNAAMRAEPGEGILFRARRKESAEEAVFEYGATGSSRIAEPGTLDFFLVERYALYAHDQRREALYRGRVHHQPYRLQEAELRQWSGAPAAWNGLAQPENFPEHVCVAEDVDVSVWGLEPVVAA